MVFELDDCHRRLNVEIGRLWNVLYEVYTT